jgi:hypothetical protein
LQNAFAKRMDPRVKPYDIHTSPGLALSKAA